MYPQWLVGATLLVIAFITPIDADLPVRGSTALTPDLSNWAGTHTAGTTRVLRTVDDNDSEERAGGLSVPVSEKVKKLFSSSKVTPDRLRQWLGEGKSADIVFDRLRLTDAKDLIFFPRSYDKLTQWLKYVDDFNVQNPTQKLSAISTLSRQYDDAVLYDLIKSARNYPEMKEVALRLHTEQMERWVAAAKDPDDVFRLMKLNKVEEGILNNPELSIWAKYVDDFNAKYTKKPASMIPVLLKYNTDDIALFRMIEAAKGVEGTKSIATKMEVQLFQFW